MESAQDVHLPAKVSSQFHSLSFYILNFWAFGAFIFQMAPPIPIPSPTSVSLRNFKEEALLDPQPRPPQQTYRTIIPKQPCGPVQLKIDTRERSPTQLQVIQRHSSLCSFPNVHRTTISREEISSRASTSTRDTFKLDAPLPPILNQPRSMVFQKL